MNWQRFFIIFIAKTEKLENEVKATSLQERIESLEEELTSAYDIIEELDFEAEHVSKATFKTNLFI